MDLKNIITLLVGFTTIIFPMVMYLRNRKSNTSRSLVLLSITAGPIWSIATFLYDINISAGIDILSLKIIYLVSIFTAFLTYWLTNSYPFKKKMRLWEILLVFGIGSFFIYELFFTYNFLTRITYLDGQRTPELGFIYIFWFMWFALLFLWRIFQIKKDMQSLKGIEKKQMSYIITGYTIVGLGVVPTNMILPFLGNFDYIWLGPIFISIMINLITYGISTTRFFNLRNIIQKIEIFIKAILIPILLSSAIFYLGKELLNYTSLFLYIFISFTAILTTYLVLRNYYEKKEDLSTKFLSKTSTVLSLDEIGQKLEELLSDDLNVSKFNYAILGSDREIIYNNNPDLKTEFVLLQQFWAYFEDYNKLIVLAELEYIRVLSIEENNIWKYKRFLSIIQYMRVNGWEVIVPIQLRDNNVALIFIGNNSKNQLYSNDEIKKIINLRSTIKLAVERGLLYRITEDFNKYLKQKVSEQTKELQQKVKQLEEARRKEADMIDIMGHELRTPMSIVKLNTDLLHNFTKNVPKKKEDFKKYVRRIKDAVDTEIKLINTLLSSAKLEGNKIELNPEKVNIIDQIKMSLHAQEGRARRKGIELKSSFSTDQPYVFADHARTVEVLNNLIDNAVKYTQKGSVEVKAQDEKEYIKISIIDTGPGMSEEDIKNLGQKFFRTQNYTKSEYSDDIDIVRPGGTGLGLYVTFSLVKKMGGQIEVKSKIGEGSTFTFTLPRYNGQESSPTNDSKDMFSRLGLRE